MSFSTLFLDQQGDKGWGPQGGAHRVGGGIPNPDWLLTDDKIRVEVVPKRRSHTRF